MKNSIKKIGLGLVASLAISGSVSGVLIANADSIKEQPLQQQKFGIDLDKLGDAQILKGAKNIYGYGILGYYASEQQKKNIKDDISDLIEWFSGDESKLEKASHKFDNAKAFLEHLKKEGMEEGLQRLIVGDAEVILMFKEKVNPGVDWNEHSEEWIENDGQNIDGIDDIDGI